MGKAEFVRKHWRGIGVGVFLAAVAVTASSGGEDAPNNDNPREPRVEAARVAGAIACPGGEVIMPRDADAITVRVGRRTAVLEINPIGDGGNYETNFQDDSDVTEAHRIDFQHSGATIAGQRLTFSYERQGDGSTLVRC